MTTISPSLAPTASAALTKLERYDGPVLRVRRRCLRANETQCKVRLRLRGAAEKILEKFMTQV